MTQTELWTPGEARRASLAELHDLLLENKARVEDYVVSANSLHMDDSDHNVLVAREQQHDITEDGVTTILGKREFHISDLAHTDLAARLDIPKRYYDRMREERVPFILAENVGYWLRHDTRKFMLRTYTRDDGPSYLRAVLSDRYARMDDEDMLAATLVGIRDAGIDPSAVSIDGDLTEKRLRVRITAKSVALNVGELLRDYRSPFSGARAADLPLMWAGLEITNSETGRGAFAITPRVVLQVCTNGMTRKMDVTRRTHLGERLDEGVVSWSHETQRRTLELVQSKTRDAVRTFLSTDYLETVAADMRESAGVNVSQPLTTLTTVAKTNGLTDHETNDLIGLFTAGGDTTALGVGHAVTALAQNVNDSDRAADLEAAFWGVVKDVARAEARI